MTALSRWRRLKTEWAVLSYYQRFESSVAFVLTLVIGLIILVALYRLTVSVIAGLVFGGLDPLDQEVFQALFGEIMTLLIASSSTTPSSTSSRESRASSRRRSCSSSPCSPSPANSTSSICTR